MTTHARRLRLVRTPDDAALPPTAALVPDGIRAAGKAPRPAYVRSVRRELDRGEYLTPERWSVALDRLIDAAREPRP